jgi:exosortase
MSPESRLLTWQLKSSAVLCALLVAGWCALLWPQWLSEPNLAHGLIMPFVLVILVYVSVKDDSPHRLRDSVGTDALELALGAAGIISLALGGLYAAAMGWSHPVSGFLATVGVAALLLLTLMALGRKGAKSIRFGWPCIAIPVLCLLCAPIPPGSSAKITALLQTSVTESVLRTLHLFGVPAFRTGNIIELAHARLGVDEACSGLRSLVSCIFAAVFISAAWVRRTGSRLIVILIAVPLALAMNLIRSLILAFAAEHQVSVSGTFHDATGSAVLGVTTLLLVAVALVLGRGESRRAAALPSKGQGPRPAAGWIALASLSVAAALGLWLASRPVERRAPQGPVPDLAAVLPSEVAGWTVSTAGDLGQFEGVLRTSCLLQRTYSRMSAAGRSEVTLYVAYWRPGQASVTAVSSHTPDICWPGSGWEPIPGTASASPLTVAGASSAAAQARSFARDGIRVNVWYWHLNGGKIVEDMDTHSPAQILADALRNGVRETQSQVFVRISSNLDREQLEATDILPVLLRSVHRLGL